MASLSYLFCVLVSLLNPINCYGHSNPEAEHKALFVFGDSLFDPGNNQYLNASEEGGGTSWPYGETFFKHPTGRLSDGRLVPDFIAQFAKLPILPAYLQPTAHRLTDGANFASAGGGVLVETHPGTISLPTQLSNFKGAVKSLRQKLGDVEAKKVLMRAVYLFSIGGNDYFNLYSQNPHATQSYRTQYVGIVIGNLTNVLKEIYSLGGRKIAFQNAGPLGCLPAMKARNPQLGSFKNGKAACCGSGAYRGMNCGGGRNRTEPYELCSNPSEYVWFDGGHTTERANRQLANLIWSGAPSVTGPYTVKQLFAHA
ncbi:GDSL esterase/lipase 1 [Morella rubra]|uniref:GDSL esterase/lipase 1 n=1 Tax=Morella rubra TaxID=262757 RepID=A0A6A1W1U8_9ROSI|nr:GDSL esterase/lipase 1 [Morella rubra]